MGLIEDIRNEKSMLAQTPPTSLFHRVDKIAYITGGMVGFGNVFGNAWNFSNHDLSAINKEG